MKKAIFGLSVMLAFGVHAAGNVESSGPFFSSGWACDQAMPNYQGWIHIWRDDGVFISALPADNQREPAVALACGDGGAHGFSGTTGSVYASSLYYLTGKMHNVHYYFIRQDGSNFELPGSPVNVYFGAYHAAPYPAPN
jgi:hypothetical protein